MTQKKSAPKRGSGATKSAPKGRGTSESAADQHDEDTASSTAPPSEGLSGALRALELALDKKALEPVLLDVRELCSFCDYQLVISGRSDRQVDAIADAISAGLKMEGYYAIGSEGARTGQWALLDYGDFVVHVFLHSAREHYDLEGLWNDAPRVPIEVPADARVPADDAYDAVS